jgi:ribonuclease Z
MMRYGTGFGCDSIYVTHLHADHCLGITGLLRTMGLQGRTEPLTIYGPEESKKTLDEIVGLGVGRVPFPVTVAELEPGSKVSYEGYHIIAFSVQHTVPALGYALCEEERPGRFDVECARNLGVPEGPLFSTLHSGNPVEVNGQWIQPEEVVGPTRPGQKLVYTGDTRPNEMVRKIAEDASLLIHEATFAEEERARADETRHSTAREAAVIARDAGVSKLLLTHISARYSDNPSNLLKEAQRVFPEAAVARDGQVFEIPYDDSEQ